MNLKEGEQKQITIYWWNFGKKTLDFEGTIKDFLLKKDIKYKQLTRKVRNDYINGFSFDMCIGIARVRLDIWEYDFVLASTNAIKLFLTYLGDKTLFYDGYSRKHKINWR